MLTFNYEQTILKAALKERTELWKTTVCGLIIEIKV